MLLRAFGQSNGIPDHDALPRLCAATERFKRAVETGSLTLDPISQAMLDDLFVTVQDQKNEGFQPLVKACF